MTAPAAIVRWRLVKPSSTPAAAAIALLGCGLAAVTTLLPPDRAVAVAVLVPVVALLPVLCRPPVALALLAVVTVTQAADVLSRHGVRGVSVGVHAVALVAAVRVLRGRHRAAWSPVYTAGLLLLLVLAASSLGATDPAAAGGMMASTTAAAVNLVLLVVLASEAGAVRSLAAWSTAAIAFVAALTLVQELFLSPSDTLWGFARISQLTDLGTATARHSGPLEDANFWARNQLLFAPVAAALAVTARRTAHRTAWALAGGVLAAGIYLTASRGALMTLLAGSFVVALVRWRRRPALLLLAAGVLVGVLVLPGVGSRLDTLGSVSAASAGEGDPSVVGRLGALRYGTAMFFDHPILGVGPGNFLDHAAEYQRIDGFLFAKPLAPHNSFLQWMAETGVLGLAAWLALYVTAGWVVVRAVHRTWQVTDVDVRQTRTTCLAAGGGLAAWLMASAFLHVAQSDVLAVAFAIAISAARVLDDTPVFIDRTIGATWRATATQAVRRGAVPAVAAAAVAWVAAVLMPTPVLTTAWHAHGDALVVPASKDANAYDVSLSTRTGVVDTLAAVADERLRDRTSGAAVSAGSSQQTALVHVHATASSPARAAALLTTAMDEAVVSAGGLPDFRLEPVPSRPGPQAGRVVAWRSVAAVLLLSALACLLVSSVIGRRLRGAGVAARGAAPPT